MSLKHLKMKLPCAFLAALFLLMLSYDTADAQFTIRWMNIGTMQAPYSEGGALREQEPFDNAPLQFPAIDHRAGNTRAQGLWVGVKNFTDEDGRTFTHKVAHVGPRSGGEVQFFPTKFDVTSRYDASPEVIVDGAQSFQRFVFVDEFDSSIKADRMMNIVNNNRVGIEMDMKVHAFSNEFHDNYHIIEYNFTNTGNVDADPDIELNATLNDVYFYFISRYALHDGASWITGNGAPWGKFTMNDAVGDGHEDYDVDFRAQFAWFGYYGDQTDFNSLGGPMWREHWTSAPVADTTGRLAAAHFVGRVTIHADASASDTNDDPLQPSTMGVKGSDDPDLVDDEFDESLMQRQYDNFLAAGRMYPHHADQIEPSGEFHKPQNSPADFLGITDEGGWAMGEGYGPYTIAPGEDVKIVVAEAAAGLSNKAKLDIGVAYKRSGADDDAMISYESGGTMHSMTKNEWVMTSRDSLFQTFERAIANYQSGMNIPQAPKPPRNFEVTSGPDKISLSWTAYSGENPAGYEIYRAGKTFQDPNGYELIATVDGGASSYDDTGVTRGIEYYYHIVAVGAVNTDATGNTPTGVALRSNPAYTQTFLPAILKRPPGNTLSDARIVPNPFNLAADENLRWPDQQDKLGFLDIPGNCTISLYTQLGELIETIEHTDGSGDEFWNHTTTSRQIVASGLYIAHIKDNDSGDEVFLKFVIIR